MSLVKGRSETHTAILFMGLPESKLKAVMRLLTDLPSGSIPSVVVLCDKDALQRSETERQLVASVLQSVATRKSSQDI